jgi:hypothetical protein
MVTDLMDWQLGWREQYFLNPMQQSLYLIDMETIEPTITQQHRMGWHSMASLLPSSDYWFKATLTDGLSSLPTLL